MVGVEGLLIREAVEADAIAMGHLHVRAWQNAYRGVMPDEYLDGLQADDRIAMWHGRISRTDLPPLLVAVVADEVVGFAVLGDEQPSSASASCGELYAMNLEPAHWGKGIGRVLLHRVTDALSSLGYEEAVLWVVPENERARALYESEGWVADGGVSTEDILGVTVTDIRYRKPLSGNLARLEAEPRMPLTIRRIRGDDGDALRVIRLAALNDSPSAFGSTYEAEVEMTDDGWTARAQLGAEGIHRVTFFALVNDRIVGLVGGFRPDSDALDVDLVSMWTAPEVRRAGVGRALVRAVVEWAREISAPSVGLWVTDGNAAAHRLYESVGFRETGESQPLPSDPSKDEVRMMLGL